MASDRPFDRYLNILGVADARPDLSGLQRIVRAQLIRVPFENVSKIHLARTLGLRGVPPVDLYLDGIERNAFGGTCYSNNHHLCSLLRHVGFDATFCGADMASGPDVHAVILVRLEGHEFLVDVGYGAPFYDPMPRNRKRPLSIRLGRNRYVLRPQDDGGRSRMEHHRDGRQIHGYLAKPTPRELAFFEPAIRDSYRPTATFMTQLRIARFLDDGNLEILGNQLLRASGRHCSAESLPDRGALLDAVVEHFGMPASVVRGVTDGLEWPPGGQEN